MEPIDNIIFCALWITFKHIENHQFIYFNSFDGIQKLRSYILDETHRQQLNGVIRAIFMICYHKVVIKWQEKEQLPVHMFM